MKKTIILTIFSLIFLLMISGCGKSDILPTGNATSDISVLSEGDFDSYVIDTSFLPGEFYVSDCSMYSDCYEYILSVYNSGSYKYDDYYLKSDLNGNLITSCDIIKPIYTNNGMILTYDIALVIGEDLVQGYVDPYVSYSSISFTESGGFESVCTVYYSVYSDLLGTTYLVSNYYNILWNDEGKCISVEKTDYPSDYLIFDEPDYETGLDGNKYKLTSSGIIKIDDNEDYVSEYFDFLNSDILSYGFDTVNILDNDHFSAVYLDEEFRNVLCCFVRDKNIKSKIKPIVLACNELSFDLKSDIYKFNSEDNGYRIAVIDYSDQSLTNDPYEGWYLLKNSFENGYRPDIILNSTGLDTVFINYVSSENALVDLRKALIKDESLNNISFTEYANNKFYSDDKIYSLVPSFNYRTIVGSTDLYSDNTEFGYEAFLKLVSGYVETSNIFRDDTRDIFIGRFLAFNGYELIDYDSKSSSFGSSVFTEYLDMISYLPEDYITAFESEYDVVGNSLLSDVTCSNLGDFNLSSTINSLGEYVDLGFPCNEGSGSGVISATKSYMIVSGRKYTNECWDFIKKYLTDEYQSNIADGIPVSQYGYINWKNNLYPYTGDASIATYFKDGEFHTVENLDENRVNYIIDHIKSCDRMEFSDYRVEQIVLEYAHQYFDGKITAEEAASLIDKDVEVYLAS